MIYILSLLFVSMPLWAQGTDSAVAVPVAAAVEAVATGGSKGTLSSSREVYFTTFANATKADFQFACPGDSLLIGMRSHYVEDERRFKFICGFFEDRNKNLLVVTLTKPSPVPDNLVHKKGTSVCAGPNQFLVGLNGAYKKASTDRIYTSLCSTYADRNKKQVSFTQTSCYAESPQQQQIKETFAFSCKPNFALTAIATEYQDTDRLFTFTCCELDIAP